MHLHPEEVPIPHLALVTGMSRQAALTRTPACLVDALVITGGIAADHTAAASCLREETENEMRVWNDNTGAR